MRDKIIGIIQKALKKCDFHFLQEMDLQVFLFHVLRKEFGDDKLYLEYPIIYNDNQIKSGNKEILGYVDLVVDVEGCYYPIELKFKTKAQEIPTTMFGNEIKYKLKNQTAYNLSCYGFWADIARMEELSKNFPSKVQRGIGVFVTNDEKYKFGPKNSAGYANFSIHIDRVVKAGEMLRWQKKSKAKLKNIKIQNECKISWQDSDINSDFMFCIL
jgi:hypothetical protein